jgi:hypothetical protein
MGKAGPLPKRSSERRRRNVDGRTDKAEVRGRVTMPPCPRLAHPIARRWFHDLRRSGQAQFFEPSDWAAALLLVEQMTRLLESSRAINGPAFAGLWSAMGDLLTTEAARRRARIEVERRPAGDVVPPPGVSDIDDFRQRMGA